MSISVDVGGTFTDFVIFEEDKIQYYKVPSTPRSPKALKEGIKNKKYEGEVLLGSTIAINAFLEKRGAETAFIVNEGFEDILFIGRQTRPYLYDLYVKKPKPPLKKNNCYGIPGRLDSKGRIVRDLDIERVRAIATELKEKSLSAAVCLLHSYVNPEHEKKIGRILEEYDIPYSLSCEVSGEFREYERGMTTLLDAYVAPLTREYFSSAEKIFEKEPLVMKSGGGLEPASTVKPVDLFYSGPAGGVAGSAYIAGITDVENIVTFDMGGTSADMATVINGKISWKDEGKVGEFPVQARMVDIVTVGSGGGSIARCDRGGILRVGPESAGSEPGPVCYDKGGEKPTITDALLLMGYINPDYFLGGTMELDEKHALSSLEKLSNELGMDFEDTLLGIFQVANSNMGKTMKKITVEKGLDPKDFAILAFGGAGPLHAAYIGEELGINYVMVPPMPGVFSAFGIATGDIVRDYSKTLISPLSEREKIGRTIKELQEKAVDGSETVYLGLRYKGQSYHINIPYEGNIEKKFHQEHERRYGYSDVETQIEVVRIHLEVRETCDLVSFPSREKRTSESRSRTCLFPEGTYETEIRYRESLTKNSNGSGPCIIEDINSSILVPPAWSYRVDSDGIIHMKG